MNRKFDTNTLLGFLLIGAIFLYFGYFGQSEESSNSEAEITQTTSADTNSIGVNEKETKDLTSEIDSSKNDSLVIDYGTFGVANNPQQEERLFTLENEVLKVVISNKGAQIVEAYLKNYQTWDSLPLHLINNNSTINIGLRADNNHYNTQDLFFDGVKQNDGSINFSLKAENGGVLNYLYSIESDDYMLKWELRSQDFAGYFEREPTLNWEMKTLRHEKSLKNERSRTNMEYRFADEDEVDDLSATSDDSEVEQNLSWVACKQQFFSTILWNKNGKFEKADLSSKAINTDENYTKVFASKLSLSKVGGELSIPMGLYLGPNKYERLKSYDQDFDKLIPLGWEYLVGLIAVWLSMYLTGFKTQEWVMV